MVLQFKIIHRVLVIKGRKTYEKNNYCKKDT